MWISWLLGTALASGWGAWDDGFVVETRDDAPVDSQLVYATNFAPTVTVIEGPGAPFSLDTVLLLGAYPRSALRLPTGTWEPDSDYVISVDSGDFDYYNSGPTEIAFRTGTDVAPPPDQLTVHGVDITDWSKTGAYLWGCCARTRTVKVAVTVPNADPWSYVEVVGDFQLANKRTVTTLPVTDHLILATGPGSHTLVFQQFLDSDLPQPPCFDIVAVSASGVSGASESFCASSFEAELDAQGCGCAANVHPGGWTGTLGLFMLLALRRRKASPLADR